jgi:LysR family transcriptional regulator, nitrogen assimilation regulatory protein
MDARKLQQFLAVCRCGSITGAAKRLNIAQPALSHAIQALEQDLGVPLLVRHARGIALTEFGEVVAGQAEIVSMELQRTRALIKERIASPAGRIRIGQPSVLAGGIAVSLVEALKRKMDSLHLEIIPGNARSNRDAVASGELDLALSYQAEADAEVSLRPLVVEDLAVATPVATGVSNQKLTFVDLEGTPLIALPRGDPIREAMESGAAGAGVRLSVYAEFGAIEDAIAAVNQTGHRAVLPRFAVARAAQAQLVGLATLGDPRVPLCLFLVTARSRTPQRAARLVGDILLETTEHLVRTGTWPGRYVGHIDSAANFVTVFTNAEA